jgi:hypothetical protein
LQQDQLRSKASRRSNRQNVSSEHKKGRFWHEQRSAFLHEVLTKQKMADKV